MAFKEAGEGGGIHGKGAHGLPIAWGNLWEDRCPRCGGDLVEFQNVDLLKCPNFLDGSIECGFKIGTAKANEIVGNMRAGLEDQTRGRADGYAVGDYQSEPPF